MEEEKILKGEEVDFPMVISNLCSEDPKEADYFFKVMEEILKYPFWELSDIERIGGFIAFSLNGGTTQIKVKYVQNERLHANIMYLLHQSITQFIKKRKLIKTRCKPDILARKDSLVVEIRPGIKK